MARPASHPQDAAQPDVQVTGELKSIKWNEERDVALLTQIVAKGVRSFATGKANNPKEKDKMKKFNQGDAWTNDVDGIIPMLKAGYGAKGQCFDGVKWPGYQSIINHVTGKPHGLLIANAHLYTPGMEQARLRPAACPRSAVPLPIPHTCCLPCRQSRLREAPRAPRTSAPSPSARI